MKPVIIIAIAVVCSIIAVSVLQLSVDPIKEIVNDNKIVKSLTFSCPEKYDIYFEKAVLSEQNMEEMLGLMDHRCFITVKAWAHQSEHHNEIWQTAWEDLSWGNQVYLGEIECQDQHCKDWREDIMIIKGMFVDSELVKQTEKDVLYNSNLNYFEEIEQRKLTEQELLIESYYDGEFKIGSEDWGRSIGAITETREYNLVETTYVLSLIQSDKEELFKEDQRVSQKMSNGIITYQYTPEAERVTSFENGRKHQIDVFHAETLAELKEPGDARIFLESMFGSNLIPTESNIDSYEWITQNGIYASCDSGNVELKLETIMTLHSWYDVHENEQKVANYDLTYKNVQRHCN